MTTHSTGISFITGLCGQWRRFGLVSVSLMVAVVAGCAVVPGDSVVYEDARDYDRGSGHGPDVVYIDRGPVYVWPGHRPFRHSARRHRNHRRDFNHGHRSGGRSTWRGRDGRRETRPNRDAGKPRTRPSPRIGRAVPVMPHKNERRSSRSDRGSRQPGNSPIRRGSPSTGPAEGEGS